MRFINPALTARMPPNSFIGITPPPMPIMDYQSDQSSTFTQTFLRGILTSIDSKDPVVANAWLETLLDAIDLLPIEVIKQEIITIAINKSQLSQPAQHLAFRRPPTLPDPALQSPLRWTYSKVYLIMIKKTAVYCIHT